MLSKAQLKVRNREIVKQLRETSDDGRFRHTYQTIGDLWGITRERVRQVGKMAGNANRNDALKERNQITRDSAPKCAIEHCSNKVKVLETATVTYSTTGRCADHGRDVVLITCAECGKQTERESYQVRSDHKKNKLRTKPQTQWFCDNHCQGKFIGREYGFIAHPENAMYAKELADALE